jgi:hypothetical protein
MFPALIQAGRKSDIHVVWNKDGDIVGATVAALVSKGGEEGPMHKALAWPITLGTTPHRLGKADLQAHHAGSSLV